MRKIFSPVRCLTSEYLRSDRLPPLKLALQTTATVISAVKRCALPIIRRLLSFWLALLLAGTGVAIAQRQKVVIDTDIGDDIDDAYAVALALRSPELEVLGITTATGDTALRTRLTARLLAAAGADGIPVNSGIPTHSKADFSQRAWAEAGPAPSQGDGVAFLLAQARRYPHQVTLVALGPLTNIGAAMDRDPAAFRLLKRVVMMGGSVPPTSNGPDSRGVHAPAPVAEYNIASDPVAAQKLFTVGVPIFMMPLNSTEVKFTDDKRAAVAAHSTSLTDALMVLTTEWQLTTHQTVPTLYDAVAMAYAIRPATCPMTSLHIQIDGAGYMKVTPGPTNVEACLNGDTQAFFALLLPRLTADGAGVPTR